MIPQAHIIAWRQQVPWQTNEQVEQDLVICRALVEIFSDEFLAGKLAFRGGTTLHKLYLNPQPRYSEDIDLVQITAEEIIRCYQKYMIFSVENPPSRKEFLDSMELKMKDDQFLGDITALLRSEEKYDAKEAWDLVREMLIAKL